MRAGHFNLNEYLSKLNESQEEGSVKSEGIIIPDGETKKAYDWLKKEYAKGKTEVKVEMRIGSQKFEPSMDFQTDLKSTKNFKAGIFGEVKTSDTEGTKNKDSEKETSESTEDLKPKKKVESNQPKKKVAAAPMKISATSKKKKEGNKE